MIKHLEKLTIHRFRGLRDLELAEMGHVNLLVGANNSGKTTVLEALSTFCQPLDPLEWLNTAWRREVKSSRTPMLDALKWLFPQSSKPENGLYTGETFVSGSGSFPVLESHATYSEFWGAANPGAATEPSLRTGDDELENALGQASEGRQRGADLSLKAITRVEQFQQIQLFNDQPAGEFTREFTETFRLWEDERFITRKASSAPQRPVATISPVSHGVEQVQIMRRFTEATLEGIAKSDVLDMVRLMDPGVEDMEILSRQGIRPTLYIRHKDVGLSPLSAFGDGMRRILMIALTLPTVRNGLLLVDEIETAIHTSALSQTFTWLVRACVHNNTQLVATTHSLEAVDTLLEVTAGKKHPEFVVYRLHRTPEAITAKRLDHGKLSMLREELGQEVR
jgi:ABC-type Na+ transport system ATPase subunit NatA